MNDDRLREHLLDLEQEAQPDQGFRDALMADLNRRASAPRPGHPSRPRMWTLAAALGGLALIGGAVAGTLVGLVPTLQRGASTPIPTVLAVSSATPGASPSASVRETATPTGSPSPTATDSQTAAASPTMSPSPTAAPTPVPTPSYGLAGVWKALADTPMLDSPRVADFIPGPGDRLYAFLWGSSSNLDNPGPDGVLVYTPSTDTWQLRQPTTTTPYGIGTVEPMVAGPDGLIYAFASGAEFTDVFAYNPEQNSWTTSELLRMPKRWIGDVAAGRDGTIYMLPLCCVGGAQLLTFDPATRSVKEIGSQPWTVSTLNVDASGLVIMSGEDGVGTYDPATKAWAWFPNRPQGPGTPRW